MSRPLPAGCAQLTPHSDSGQALQQRHVCVLPRCCVGHTRCQAHLAACPAEPAVTKPPCPACNATVTSGWCSETKDLLSQQFVCQGFGVPRACLIRDSCGGQSSRVLLKWTLRPSILMGMESNSPPTLLLEGLSPGAPHLWAGRASGPTDSPGSQQTLPVGRNLCSWEPTTTAGLEAAVLPCPPFPLPLPPPPSVQLAYTLSLPPNSRPAGPPCPFKPHITIQNPLPVCGRAGPSCHLHSSTLRN